MVINSRLTTLVTAFAFGFVSLWVVLGSVMAASESVSSVTGVLQPAWLVESVSDVFLADHAAVALSTSGEPHVTFYDEVQRDLIYLFREGRQWGRVTVASEGDVGLYTSLVLDEAHQPHITFYDASLGILKYAHWTGESWLIEVVDDAGDTGLYSVVSLNGNGQPVVVYFSRTEEAVKLATRAGNGGWQAETVVVLGSQERTYLSLVIGDGDVPHVSFYDSVERTLNYATVVAGEWLTGVVDDDQWVGQANSIGVDEQGYPHISYFDNFNRHVKYAGWTGSEWLVEVVAEVGGFILNIHTSLAVDSTGVPFVSYHTPSPSRIEVAHRSENGWVAEEAGQGLLFATGRTLVLDEMDVPVVVFKTSASGLTVASRRGQVAETAVDETGGMLSVAGWGEIVFPAGAFSVPVTVSWQTQPALSMVPVVTPTLCSWADVGLFFSLSAVAAESGEAVVETAVPYDLQLEVDSTGGVFVVADESIRPFLWRNNAWTVPISLTSNMDIEAQELHLNSSSLGQWGIFGESCRTSFPFVPRN